MKPRGMRRRKTRQRNKRLAERRRGQRQPGPWRILIHRTEPPRRRPSHHGGLRRVRVWAMRAVIFGYFGTLALYSSSSRYSSDSLVITHPFYPLKGQRLTVLFSQRKRTGLFFVCEVEG